MVAHGAAEPKLYDGSELRIGIVHARWNSRIIEALVQGAKESLTKAGVREENIVVQTVPGSYELPFAVQRMYASSQIQSSASASGGALLASATDLLSSTSMTDLTKAAEPAKPKSGSTASKDAFDAIIAIGCLIKGETMHFEYIADAVSHGLMRVQLDAQVPVVFGLLTVLTEEQGLARAGIGGEKAHNHGLDWGSAAVELAVKRRGWSKGEMIE
ncbi:6,7-dimethyl-8-ribityllumazine synthase, variant [Verruconis gallopava]|uniref:6,7-dimethyl-8-ribityllumazine synthase n=1 Tax=Verruconis gallopava TaxID=253628 RepID=A0A0D1YEN4_9PEZI|nr:6,7-dimethyl-8-ribityllumazine synthase, variant [Verruconis gallopava]KIV99191.1 6,7-dimethyl-8-ribityllumazine synthase, variant [Verruconis gallopava]